MKSLSTAIQCTDQKTSQVGSFIHEGDFNAISPVFDSLVQLFKWMKIHGYESMPCSYTEVREVANA